MRGYGYQNKLMKMNSSRTFLNYNITCLEFDATGLHSQIVLLLLIEFIKQTGF